MRLEKRGVMRLATLVVGVSSLGAAYWFTRPPELVWWKSPPIGNTGHHLKLLIPANWAALERYSLGRDLKDHWEGYFRIVPADRRPAIIRRLFPARQEVGEMELDVLQSHTGSLQYTIVDALWKVPVRETHRSYQFLDLFTTVEFNYGRADAHAFNRTYRQICDSLRIE